MGVAKDTYPHDGDDALVRRGFAEVEVDVETGEYRIVDYLAVADVGTVDQSARPRRPDARRIDARHRPRHRQKWVYDQHYGVPLAKRFYHNKPPTILDVAGEHGSGRRSGFRIRKRRSARAASASRRSGPATAR